MTQCQRSHHKDAHLRGTSSSSASRVNGMHDSESFVTSWQPTPEQGRALLRHTATNTQHNQPWSKLDPRIRHLASRAPAAPVQQQKTVTPPLYDVYRSATNSCAPHALVMHHMPTATSCAVRKPHAHILSSKHRKRLNHRAHGLHALMNLNHPFLRHRGGGGFTRCRCARVCH